MANHSTVSPRFFFFWEEKLILSELSFWATVSKDLIKNFGSQPWLITRGFWYCPYWAGNRKFWLYFTISKPVFNYIINLLILHRNMLCSLLLATTTWWEKVANSNSGHCSQQQHSIHHMMPHLLLWPESDLVFIKSLGEFHVTTVYIVTSDCHWQG